MKSQNLLNAFQYVDDRYLELADLPGKGASFRRAPQRVLLIAAIIVLMLALSVSAYAANLFGAADMFRALFGNVTPAQAELMEELSAAELPPAVTANGTTVTPLALLSDGKYYYARLRIEAPEGTVLNIPEESSGFLQIFGEEPETAAILHDADGNQTGYSQRVQWHDETENDNALDLYLFIERTSFSSANSVFTFQGLWIQDQSKNYIRLLEGPWSIDLSFAFAADHRELDVDGMAFLHVYNGETLALEEGEFTVLRSMSVSPLSLEFSYDYASNDPRKIPGPGLIQLVTYAGETIAVSQLAGSSWNDSHCSFQFLFDYPIVLSEVDYIRFGDLQIQVN